MEIRVFGGDLFFVKNLPLGNDRDCENLKRASLWPVKNKLTRTKKVG